MQQHWLINATESAPSPGRVYHHTYSIYLTVNPLHWS